MKEIFTKKQLQEMAGTDLTHALTRHVWGAVLVGSVQAVLVEEAVNRLNTPWACIKEPDFSKTIDWAVQSYQKAVLGEPIPCRGCVRPFALHRLFRCFICGAYFCSDCAAAHFGDRPGQRTPPASLFVCRDRDCETRVVCTHAEPHEPDEECQYRCDSAMDCSRCHPVEKAL